LKKRRSCFFFPLKKTAKLKKEEEDVSIIIEEDKRKNDLKYIIVHIIHIKLNCELIKWICLKLWYSVSLLKLRYMNDFSFLFAKAPLIIYFNYFLQSSNPSSSIIISRSFLLTLKKYKLFICVLMRRGQRLNFCVVMMWEIFASFIICLLFKNSYIMNGSLLSLLSCETTSSNTNKIFNLE